MVHRILTLNWRSRLAGPRPTPHQVAIVAVEDEAVRQARGAIPVSCTFAAEMDRNALVARLTRNDSSTMPINSGSSRATMSVAMWKARPISLIDGKAVRDVSCDNRHEGFLF